MTPVTSASGPLSSRRTRTDLGADQPSSPTPSHSPAPSTIRVALLGNPNTGKTTLFNRLCGLRAKTANFPGVTTEARIGRATAAANTPLEFVDLPGVYRLSLDLPEARVCRDVVAGSGLYHKPDAIVVVVDATNLARNLVLVGELLAAAGEPVIVALNMIDLAQRRGLSIDSDKLSDLLGCPVVPMNARSGLGVDRLRHVIATTIPIASQTYRSLPAILPPASSPAALVDWADSIASQSVGGDSAIGDASDTFTERLDKAFTHPVAGIIVFHLVMAGLFASIFWFAQFPMTAVDWLFSQLGGLVDRVVPPGAIQNLLSDGVIGGLGGTIVFLPQICLLFFLISLLEDTGYLARAAFVMDRFMCRFGLPGQAFLPLLSSHACAIPGIMSAKLIPDRSDRLATILVAPFMSCSARIPVYVLLTSLLFAGKPFLAGVAFFGCYLLGAIAAMLSVWIARRTILPGRSRPMVLELPTYKWPSLRTAFLTSYDRGVTFLKKAGTVIMAVCVLMWWASAYPVVDPPPEAVALRAQAAAVETSDPTAAADLAARADLLTAEHAQAQSFAGRIGRFVQPVFAPLGYDWKLSVGVMTSFAAREVFVSTMAVLLIGDNQADFGKSDVVARISRATRDDGSPVFTTATSASLLVFYVLAMQCLATLVITKRETGSWKWSLLQLAWMSTVAYIASFVVYQGLRAIGVS